MDIRYKILAAGLMLVMLPGCALTIAERTDYREGKALSPSGRPLDMPPELVLPKEQGDSAKGGEQVATYSDYARTTGGAGGAASGTLAAQPATRAILRELPGKDKGKSILLGEPFDRCWLRVSQAMVAKSIIPEDKDRSKGIFYLKGGVKLSVQAGGQSPHPSCEVTAANADGSALGDALNFIELLYSAMAR